MRITLVKLIFLVLSWTLALAQPSSGVADEIPPLDRVISSALAHAPTLKMQAALVSKNEFALARTSQEWLDAFSIGTSATFGSYGNQLIDEVSTGMTGGITIRLSLFDLFSRKNQRGEYEEEVNVSRYKQEEIAQGIRQLVTLRYNELQLKHRLVGILVDAWQSAEVHRQMAEAEFAQNDIPVSELARVSEIAAKAQTEYETARFEYTNTYAQLELLAGTSLSSLK